MSFEGFGGQSFYHSIGQHLGAWYPFDGKLSFINKFADVIVLHIDVLGTALTLRVLCQGYAHLVVAMQDNAFYRLQFHLVDELSDPYSLPGAVT